MRQNRLRGLTLVELLVALSIFAIVAVALYSTFGTGISTWKKIKQAQDLYQDIRLTLDKMALDLENAVLYSEKPEFVNFQGGKSKISFYSTVETSQALPGHTELRKIAYSLDESGHILQRREQALFNSGQNTEEEAQEIAAAISRLDFFYCYEDEHAEPPYKWQDSWDFPQELPQGIKIELGLDTEKNLVFSKYVFIPTGRKGK